MPYDSGAETFTPREIAMKNASHIIPTDPFTLYLVRHAQSLANACLQRAEESATNTDLSQKGMHEATALARHLTHLGITHVGSSDMRRATETRHLLLSGTPGAIILPPSDLLHELSRGDDKDSGFPPELKRYMDLMGPHYRSPNGDSLCDVATKYLAWIYGTVSEIQQLRSDDVNLLVVGHGNAIKATLHAMLGLDPRASNFTSPIRNTGVTTLRFHSTSPPDYRTAWSLISYNEAPHLGLAS